MSRAINYIMHIPKTAGLSLQGLVRRRHKKPGALELVYTQEAVERGFEDRPELETVMGHYRFGHHRFSERPFRYFTFLRHPVEQVVSHFNYSFDHPDKFRDLPKGIANVVDFARCPYGYNLQTRFISGIDDIHGRGPEAVAEAKANLERHFELIGLTEEFDLSLLMLGQAMQWHILYYVQENQGKRRIEQARVSEHEKTELEEILEYDMQLYRHAQELFEQQKARHPKLVKRLPSFRRENRLFQQLNPSYIRLKQLF